MRVNPLCKLPAYKRSQHWGCRVEDGRVKGRGLGAWEGGSGCIRSTFRLGWQVGIRNKGRWIALFVYLCLRTLNLNSCLL